MAREGWVTITHPDDPAKATQEVPQAAFDEVWALPKYDPDTGKTIPGWVVVAPEVVAASELLGKPVGSIDDLSEEELVAIASRKGIAFDEKTKATTLAKKVSEALKPQASSETSPSQASSQTEGGNA